MKILCDIVCEVPVLIFLVFLKRKTSILIKKFRVREGLDYIFNSLFSLVIFNLGVIEMIFKIFFLL